MFNKANNVCDVSLPCFVTIMVCAQKVANLMRQETRHYRFVISSGNKIRVKNFHIQQNYSHHVRLTEV